MAAMGVRLYQDLWCYHPITRSRSMTLACYPANTSALDIAGSVCTNNSNASGQKQLYKTII